MILRNNVLYFLNINLFLNFQVILNYLPIFTLIQEVYLYPNINNYYITDIISKNSLKMHKMVTLLQQNNNKQDGKNANNI